MGKLIKWWLRWTLTGLKLLVLVIAAAAAVGAIHMGAMSLEIIYTAFSKPIDPELKKVLYVGWRVIVHTLQLAMFAFVVVGGFPEFFAKELAEIQAKKEA
ncbi:MAG: hypothetical protein ACKVHO_19635 [Verrucomicrobiia bacterium]|jgi:hypothetical protein